MLLYTCNWDMERKFYILIAPLIPSYNASYLEGNQLSGILLIGFTAIHWVPSEKGLLNLIASRVFFLLRDL